MDWLFIVELNLKENLYKQNSYSTNYIVIYVYFILNHNFQTGVRKKMKASEFVGMKVLDKEANEVGKVDEIAVVFGRCLVNKIFISVGSALNKKYLVIVNDDIAEVGNYLQLKLNKKEIEEHKVDKIDDNLGNGTRFNDFTGKTVLTINGMEVGKVTDMVIDPKGCLIHNIVVTSGNALNKKNLMISNEDISVMGDYLILKLDQEQVKERMID